VIHAWSARDVKTGAWNLRGWRWLQWLQLNYTVHRVHHEQPQWPWYELPAQVPRDEPRPSFWRVYRSLWRGVRPAPPMGAAADLAYLGLDS
jgi:fatty acid desaturase